MDSAELLTLINQATSINAFVETHLLRRDAPWLFQETGIDFVPWRHQVAQAAGVPSSEIYLVGSAATGFSLSPLKLGRPFRKVESAAGRSDIDIAIVSSTLFERCWDGLRLADYRGRAKAGLRPHSGQTTQDQVTRLRANVYFGVVSGFDVARTTDLASRVRAILDAVTRQSPTQGYPARLRIYRRRFDLVAYHEQSLRQLAAELRTAGKAS